MLAPAPPIKRAGTQRRPALPTGRNCRRPRARPAAPRRPEGGFPVPSGVRHGSCYPRGRIDWPVGRASVPDGASVPLKAFEIGTGLGASGLQGSNLRSDGLAGDGLLDLDIAALRLRRVAARMADRAGPGNDALAE